MNIALIGSGGREHALCQKIHESKLSKKIICIPGNAGTAKIAKNIINSYQGKVIAITGSNGKTSTTNILSKTLKKSSKTIGNYN